MPQAFPADAAWVSRTTPPYILPAGSKVFAGRTPGTWNVTVPAGEEGVVVYLDPTAKPPFVVAPLPANKTEEHWFGYNRPMQPLH